MTADEFQSIMDFAMERELEAKNFYLEMAKTTADEEIKKEMLKLSEMESNHFLTLQRLKNEIKIFEHSVKPLNSADYLLKVETIPAKSYEDLILTALKREQKSLELYNMLASQMVEEDYRKIFHFLAEEEATHKAHFEKLYDDNLLRKNAEN